MENIIYRHSGENKNATNKGRSIDVDLCRGVNVSLLYRFENSKMFIRTSKIIQNDVLPAFRKQILLEIATAKFISITVDETADVVDMFRLVFRYEI